MLSTQTYYSKKDSTSIFMKIYLKIFIYIHMNRGNRKFSGVFENIYMNRTNILKNRYGVNVLCAVYRISCMSICTDEQFLYTIGNIIKI